MTHNFPFWWAKNHLFRLILLLIHKFLYNKTFQVSENLEGLASQQVGGCGRRSAIVRRSQREAAI
ncbi:MAG: hypothetical protein ABIG63_12380 [Chloroflexota bacterium]